ncbi:hypothetical protein VCLMA_A0158 [Vibrio cholerae LMA3984-4]|nr:hypothetical protein VCLMA_A0158 [Vibrio cholerae LMA3984-4]
MPNWRWPVGQKAQAGRLSVLDPVWHVKQTDAARHSKNPL